jgi:nuclear transcription factor Y gamma
MDPHPHSPTAPNSMNNNSSQHAQQLAQQHQQMMSAFWSNQIAEIETGHHDFKFHQLPLARIKKVMKADEDVKASSIC